MHQNLLGVLKKKFQCLDPISVYAGSIVLAKGLSTGLLRPRVQPGLRSTELTEAVLKQCATNGAISITMRERPVSISRISGLIIYI